MLQKIVSVNFGGVNCYLLQTDRGFVLIDNGYPNKRAALEKKLAAAGCKPGDLKLVILTHGDHDHAGNGAYLQQKYGVKIAMHAADAGMVELGDMSWNRKHKADKSSLFFLMLSPIMVLMPSGKFSTFKPDLTVDEGFDLSAYGLDAAVLHLPGHSKGSLGILTSAGDLFCGDLIYNFFGLPGFIYSIDNISDHRASIAKLQKLTVKTVYPGHGSPFPLQRYLKRHTSR